MSLLAALEFGLTGQVVTWSLLAVVAYALSRAVIRAWFVEKARHMRNLMRDDK